MKIIDCSGLSCPKPVIMTKKEMDSIATGEFEVIVDNVAARDNVSKYVNNEGHSCTVVEKDGKFSIIVKKEECVVCNKLIDDDDNLVIFIGSDKFGQGDDKLGDVLMKGYLYALTEVDRKPKTILFANSGVRLTTQGSEVLESLKVLQEKGVELLSCGTCLDFYGLKEKLVIGSISNMYTMVDKMNNAKNNINL